MPEPTRRSYYTDKPVTLTVPGPDVSLERLREQVVSELGWEDEGVRPTGRKVFLKTDPVREMSDGGLHLPVVATRLNRGLPKGKTVWGIALYVGPKCVDVKAGDHIAFPRGSSGLIQRLRDRTQVSFIHEDEVFLSEERESSST